MIVKDIIKQACAENDTYQIGCVTVYLRNKGLDYNAISRMFQTIGGMEPLKYDRHMVGFDAMRSHL